MGVLHVAPGGDDEAYLNDYYVVPPTCGDYSCRDFYGDLGFIKDSQQVFPRLPSTCSKVFLWIHHLLLLP